MKKFGNLIITVMMLTGVGCYQSHSSAPLDNPTSNKVAIDYAGGEAAWLIRYTDTTNRFTERVYQCEIEMHSLVYEPVDSGPVCREMCKEMAAVNAMVDAAPNYIDNPKQYHLAANGLCIAAPRKRRHEEKR